MPGHKKPYLFWFGGELTICRAAIAVFYLKLFAFVSPTVVNIVCAP